MKSYVNEDEAIEDGWAKWIPVNKTVLHVKDREGNGVSIKNVDITSFSRDAYDFGARFGIVALGKIFAETSQIWIGNKVTKRYRQAGLDKALKSASEFIKGVDIYDRSEW